MLLASRADGTKINPLIIFKGKRPKKEEKYVTGVTVVFTDNGWINDDVAAWWMRKAIGCLRSSRVALIWDTYSAHMTPKIHLQAKECKTELLYIPGGCTGLVQPADVSWNKPFKGEYSITLAELPDSLSPVMLVYLYHYTMESVRYLVLTNFQYFHHI